MARAAKKSVDIDGARAFALEVAQQYLRPDYPEWWGPVADLYASLGLSLEVVPQSDGSTRQKYVLLPGVGRILAREAQGDAEAYDLAINVCVSCIDARQPVPNGMEDFVTGVIRGDISCPPRAKNTPVKHWKRDTTLFHLIHNLREKYGLFATPRKSRTENASRLRQNQMPSGSAIAFEAFRIAGVPQTDQLGVQISETTSSKIWGDKNVQRRLKKALENRSVQFHQMLDEIKGIDLDVPDQTLE